MVYNLIGFITSTIFYLLLIVSLGFYLQQKSTKNVSYTTNKKDTLNITLIEKKDIQKKPNRKKDDTKHKKSTIEKGSKSHQKATNSPKKVSLQGLFDSVDIKKLPEQKVIDIDKKRENLPKEDLQAREDQNKTRATKLVEELKLNRAVKKLSKDGIYDEFRGKIQEILDAKWQMTIGTISGNKAIVSIYIDRVGNFSYKIDKLSYNNMFNSKLVNFLESMKDEEFPPFKDGEVFTMRVEFKDELE